MNSLLARRRHIDRSKSPVVRIDQIVRLFLGKTSRHIGWELVETRGMV